MGKRMLSLLWYNALCTMISLHVYWLVYILWYSEMSVDLHTNINIGIIFMHILQNMSVLSKCLGLFIRFQKIYVLFNFILVMRLYSKNSYLIFFFILPDANPSGCVFSSHSFFSAVHCLWLYIEFSGSPLTWVLCIVDWCGTICIFLNGNIQ